MEYTDYLGAPAPPQKALRPKVRPSMVVEIRHQCPRHTVLFCPAFGEKWRKKHTSGAGTFQRLGGASKQVAEKV
jgi:hypothetical protein